MQNFSNTVGTCVTGWITVKALAHPAFICSKLTMETQTNVLRFFRKRTKKGKKC